MFKIILIILVFNLSNWFVQTETIETWGEMYNVRAIGFESVSEPWSIFYKIRNRTLTFPSVSLNLTRIRIRI